MKIPKRRKEKRIEDIKMDSKALSIFINMRREYSPPVNNPSNAGPAKSEVPLDITIKNKENGMCFSVFFKAQTIFFSFFLTDVIFKIYVFIYSVFVLCITASTLW